MSGNRKTSFCIFENEVECFRKNERQDTKKQSLFIFSVIREKVCRSVEIFCTWISWKV